MYGEIQKMTDQSVILQKAIDHYGEDHQVNKTIEELAELIVQLAKRQNEQGLRIHLLEEIADASIMIDQTKIIFGKDLIESIITEKLHRLRERINEDEMSLVSGAI